MEELYPWRSAYPPADGRALTLPHDNEESFVLRKGNPFRLGRVSPRSSVLQVDAHIRFSFVEPWVECVHRAEVSNLRGTAGRVPP
ncbi:MAG: hypothetical protein ACYCOU_23055 [Sulfobacillus sp.]